MKCSKCGTEISADIQPSEDWKYYCSTCGLEEALKEIRDSNKYYGFDSPIKGEIKQ